MPPVTALRSPPDSRMTGADSPVMADSSTVAMPQTMSPSPGISSPARHDDDVAEREVGRRDLESSRSLGRGIRRPRRTTSTRWAIVLVRVLRRLSACALPRPSATDSARFAKSTVSQSHTAMPAVKPTGTAVPPDSPAPAEERLGDRDDRREGRADLDEEHDRVAPHARGSSLRNAPGSAWTSCAQLKAPLARELRLGSLRRPVGSRGESCWWTWSDEPFRQGTQREYGEVGECGDDDGDADQEARRTAAV